MSERIARECGITYRQLDHWVRRGWVRPFNPTAGSGRFRYWPAAELTVARDMGLLIRAGLTVSAAHRVARKGRTDAVLALLVPAADEEGAVA